MRINGVLPGLPVALREGLRLLRPQQWTKNVFVLAPLLFSESIGKPWALVAAANAFSCFCLWSSGVYCINDVIDAPADFQHPRKRNRPIPSGHVGPALAVCLAVALIALGSVVAMATLPIGYVIFGYVYLANSILYCLFTKHYVIVDVLSIAIGFVLRLLAGCAAIMVSPSSWILVCGFSLAMLLGFGKRRLELASLGQPDAYRHALKAYSVEKLNLLLGIVAALCLLSYMLYTVSPETVQLHGTEGLVYSVPFVAYGVFRYLFKVQEGQHDGPVQLLLRDPVFAINGLLWMGAVVVILYILKPRGS